MSGYRVVDHLAKHADTQPNKTATVELPSGRRHTYAQMHERAGRLAAHLKSLGVQPGDRVGFLALNTCDILDIVFATWRIGGIVLALNFRLTADELTYIVEDATPKVLIVDDDFREVAERVRMATQVEHWISFDGKGGDSEFERAIAGAGDCISHRIDQTLEETCMLMYSSGTTGRPKGVMITYAMLHFAATAGIGPANASSATVSLCSMPLFHIAAMNVSALPSIFIGATIVVMRLFEAEAVLNAIDDAELGITHFFAVPSAFNVLRQHPKADTTDYSRLISVKSGAETVPPPLVKWWGERGVTLQEGYGLTETSGQGCMLPKEYVVSKPGSAGKALMHDEMKIMASDTREADDDETGEIWMRGGIVTPGYWNWPEATQKAFVGEWFRTGDIGRRDSDGFFYIEDRVKDMYISGGENVYPAEVEGVLYGMDAIREVAVIGVANDTWGEVGCACVALKDGATLDLETVQAFCGEKLAKYKQPQHLVFIEALPRNATGKVQKFRLRDTYGPQFVS